VFQKTKIGFCLAWIGSQKPPSVFPNTFFFISYELCPKTYFSARIEAYISCHLHLPSYWQCKKKEARHHDLVPEGVGKSIYINFIQFQTATQWQWLLSNLRYETVVGASFPQAYFSV